MEDLTFSKVVGFILATAFAIVIGVSSWALTTGDYMNSGFNEQGPTHRTHCRFRRTVGGNRDVVVPALYRTAWVYRPYVVRARHFCGRL